MKKKILGIPLLAVLSLLLIPAVALAAYLVLTITMTVTVPEVISVAPTQVDLQLDPGATHVEEVQIENQGSEDLIVTLTLTVAPEGELVVDYPETVEVRSGKTEKVDIILTAPVDIAPDTYSVSIDVLR